MIKRFAVDLLERGWWPCNVLSEALLSGLVEYANAVIYAWSQPPAPARPRILRGNAGSIAVLSGSFLAYGCGTTLVSPKDWRAMTVPVRNGLPVA